MPLIECRIHYTVTEDHSSYLYLKLRKYCTLSLLPPEGSKVMLSDGTTFKAETVYYPEVTSKGPPVDYVMVTDRMLHVKGGLTFPEWVDQHVVKLKGLGWEIVEKEEDDA